METALKCLIADRVNNRSVSEWDKLLPNVLYALNTTISTATGKSPFELLYGFPPRNGIDPDPSSSIDVDLFIDDRR